MRLRAAHLKSAFVGPKAIFKAIMFNSNRGMVNFLFKIENAKCQAGVVSGRASGKGFWTDTDLVPVLQ